MLLANREMTKVKVRFYLKSKVRELFLLLMLQIENNNLSVLELLTYLIFVFTFKQSISIHFQKSVISNIEMVITIIIFYRHRFNHLIAASH